MFDVVCVGVIYLDLTFAGLDRLPKSGEERWVDQLLLSPGGMANMAVGLSRLGLETALVSPLGNDVAGRYLRELLEDEGIRCFGPTVSQTAVTAVLPVDGDRTMVSYEPQHEHLDIASAGVPGRAVVRLLDQIVRVPAEAPTYAVTSHEQVHAAASGRGPAAIPPVHALIANEQEALALSAAQDPESAARMLSQSAGTAVVTLGARGALAACGAVLERVEAPHVEVRDATGAGDLFAAAYVWADLQGRSLAERMRWASLYAALSLRQLTAFAGAVRLPELEAYARQLFADA